MSGIRLAVAATGILLTTTGSFTHDAPMVEIGLVLIAGHVTHPDPSKALSDPNSTLKSLKRRGKPSARKNRPVKGREDEKPS